MFRGASASGQVSPRGPSELCLHLHSARLALLPLHHGIASGPTAGRGAALGLPVGRVHCPCTLRKALTRWGGDLPAAGTEGRRWRREEGGGVPQGTLHLAEGKDDWSSRCYSLAGNQATASLRCQWELALSLHDAETRWYSWLWGCSIGPWS